MDLQVGESLVVLEIAIELGLDVLDQPGFHEQGIDLALRLQAVYIADFEHQAGRARVFGCRL